MNRENVGTAAIVTDVVRYTVKLTGKQNGILRNHFGKQMTKEIKLRMLQLKRS